MEVEPYTTYVQKENVIYNSVSDLTVEQNLLQGLSPATWMIQQHWKGRETLYKRHFIKKGYWKKLRGFLQIWGQHSSLGLFKHLCLLMSLYSTFFSCFAFFLGKGNTFLWGDWPHAVVFPGKAVVISLPFAVLALEILVLSVTSRHYFDALDTMLHTFGRWEDCYFWTKMKHSSINSHFFLIHKLLT